ncbi:MAG: hypothetical protein HY716_14490 [Planctomycetes bacterium]|nr:hypothetical protein [Planctomycetota bacterium]
MTRKRQFKKGPRKLPAFRSAEEEARFFETHSMAGYWDQMEDVDQIIELAPALARRIQERMKKRLLALRIEEWQIERAKQIARRKHVPYQQLMREWISRGIRSEGTKKRRAQ